MNIELIKAYVSLHAKKLTAYVASLLACYLLGVVSVPSKNHAEECDPELRQIKTLRSKLEEQESKIQTLILEAVQRSQKSEREICRVQKAQLSSGLRELNCEICNREIR